MGSSIRGGRLAIVGQPGFSPATRVGEYGRSDGKLEGAGLFTDFLQEVHVLTEVVPEIVFYRQALLVGKAGRCGYGLVVQAQHDSMAAGEFGLEFPNNEKVIFGCGRGGVLDDLAPSWWC